MLEFHTFSC